MQHNFVIAFHHSVLSCKFFWVYKSGLLRVLTGRERASWPIVWTGYKFLDIKPLTILFSGCSSLIFSLMNVPSHDLASQFSQNLIKFWLTYNNLTCVCPHLASSHLCNQRVFHPPRWRCSFHPFSVCTFFLPDLRQHSALTDSLYVRTMNLEPLPGHLQTFRFTSNYFLDISIQICHRKFQFNISNLTKHHLSTHLVYICSLLQQTESSSLSNPQLRFRLS